MYKTQWLQTKGEIITYGNNFAISTSIEPEFYYPKGIESIAFD